VKRVRLDWIGLTLILWSVLTRAAVSAEPLPGWDADPTQMSIAIIGIGPTGSLVFDIAAWFGAGCIFFHRRKNSAKLDPLVLVSFVGALCILARTLLVDGADTEAVRIGSSWAAAWVGFAGVLSLAHRSLVRTVLGALLAGFVLFLCSKAFVQVFVEHPHMIAQFDADPVASLSAQGIEPGSAQALSYERRLRQPAPTGWFGLSNILASLFAGVVVLFVYTTLRARGALRITVAVAGLAAGGALLTTGSKAGLAVACLGIGLIVVSRFVRGRLTQLACLAAIATPVAAVVFRGLAGIPGSDLSLLVRWFYMRGAVRITGGEMPLGTGPTGFQSAYMLAKPPEGTEDVISPHMIWLDYSATLGLAAIPVLLALAWVVVRLCKQISLPDPIMIAPSKERLRVLRPYVVLVLIVPVLIGAWLEIEATPIETAVSRLVGVLAWAGVSLAMLWGGFPTRRGLALAGVVLLCHAQLDMNMTLPGSVPLVLLCFALAASTKGPRRISVPALPMGILAGAASAGLVVTTISVWDWESNLRTASHRLSVLVDERDAMLSQTPSPSEFADLQHRFDEAGARSLDELEHAIDLMPADTRIPQASARLAMTLAGSASSVLDQKRAHAAIDRAIDILTEALQTHDQASIQAQLASIRLEKIRLLQQGPVRESLLTELQAAATAGLTRAAELTPYNSRYPASLALALSEMGQAESASRWAAEALSRDELSALDPLMALPESTRRRLARIARNP